MYKVGSALKTLQSILNDWMQSNKETTQSNSMVEHNQISVSIFIVNHPFSFRPFSFRSERRSWEDARVSLRGHQW